MFDIHESSAYVNLLMLTVPHDVHALYNGKLTYFHPLFSNLDYTDSPHPVLNDSTG